MTFLQPDFLICWLYWYIIKGFCFVCHGSSWMSYKGMIRCCSHGAIMVRPRPCPPRASTNGSMSLPVMSLAISRGHWCPLHGGVASAISVETYPRAMFPWHIDLVAYESLVVAYHIALQCVKYAENLENIYHIFFQNALVLTVQVGPGTWKVRFSWWNCCYLLKFLFSSHKAFFVHCGFTVRIFNRKSTTFLLNPHYYDLNLWRSPHQFV